MPARWAALWVLFAGALLLVALVAVAAPAAAQTDGGTGGGTEEDGGGAAGDDAGGGADDGEDGGGGAGGGEGGGGEGGDLEVPEVPEVSVELDGEGDSTLSRTVVVILLLTVGSVAPALLLLMTTFTRFVVVLSLTKNALGLQTVPPGQVLIGLALFLTFFAMQPVLTEVNDNALQPLLDGEAEQEEAFDAAAAPLRTFMLEQTDQQDLELMFSMTERERPETAEETPLLTLVPAFVVSELRTAFIAGFVIYVPFLVIDLVVASVLMSMGMVMLPPVFISLPVKLLLFILVDGWGLIAATLISGVR